MEFLSHTDTDIEYLDLVFGLEIFIQETNWQERKTINKTMKWKASAAFHWKNQFVWLPKMYEWIDNGKKIIAIMTFSGPEMLVITTTENIIGSSSSSQLVDHYIEIWRNIYIVEVFFWKIENSIESNVVCSL